MRAVVIAIKENRAAVAAEGGDLRYVADRGYVIGQIIEIDDAKETPEKVRRRHFSFARYRYMIAAAAVMLIFLGSVTANAAAVSTVTLDVNPSVSYELNVFDRVVGVTANNEDGAGLLAEISGDVMFKKLPVAFQITLDSIKERGLGATEELLVTTSVETHNYLGINREEIIVKELENTADVWNMRQSDCQVTIRNSTETLLPESENNNDNIIPDVHETDGIDNMDDEVKGTESNDIEPSDERDAQPYHHEPGEDSGDGQGRDSGADRSSEEPGSDMDSETSGEGGHHDNEDDREERPEDKDGPSSKEKHQVPPPPAATEDNLSDDEHIPPPPADLEGQQDMEEHGNMPHSGEEDISHNQEDPANGEGDNRMPPSSQADPGNASSDDGHMPPPPPDTLDDQGKHDQSPLPAEENIESPSFSYDFGEHDDSHVPPPPQEHEQNSGHQEPPDSMDVPEPGS